MIHTGRLTKRYGAHCAVENLDLDVSEGDFFGLLGPNGAGKTTTIRMLCGLVPPSSGRISVNGFDPRRQPTAVKQAVGVVCESHGYYAWMSGEQYLSYFADLYGIAHKAQRVTRLLAAVGLQEAKRKPVEAYSRGMRQRLGIARAIIHQPQVLILDEPTLGLDPQSRANLWEEVRQLRAQGTTVFVTTHYLDEADALCDRLAIIDGGKIVAEGSPDELKQQIGGDLVTVGVAPDVLEQARALLVPLPAVDAVEVAEGAKLRLQTTRGESLLPEVVRTLETAGLSLVTLALSRPTLNDVFLRQTGRSLREE